MNLDLILAIASQKANILNLIGSWFTQIAAEMEASEGEAPWIEDAATYYNILGNQIITVASIIYWLVGQVQVNQLLAEMVENTEQEKEQSTSQSIVDTPVPAAQTYPAVWRIKRVKKVKRRRWRTQQNYRQPG